jgi:CRP/FNR family transcriptional regulator, nitrogen oxide reductase regulator
MSATATKRAHFESRLFAGIPAESVEEILRAARLERFGEGESLVVAGQKGAHLFLVRKGRIRYYRPQKTGNDVVLHWLVAGDIFGIVAILSRPPSYFGTAEALTAGEVYTWEHKEIRRLVVRHPLLSENILRITLRYLKTYIDRHVSLTTKSAEARLGESLLTLAHRAGEVHPDGIELDVTNQQLSELADVSQFTVSRLLSAWERSGTVAKGRSRVRIQVPERLLTN